MEDADAGRKARCRVVFDEIEGSDSEISQTALSMLLEDPGLLLSGFKNGPWRHWRKNDQPWQEAAAPPGLWNLDLPVEQLPRHTFKEFRRRCSYGRQMKYRIHRFVLSGDALLETNHSLRCCGVDHGPHATFTPEVSIRGTFDLLLPIGHSNMPKKGQKVCSPRTLGAITVAVTCSTMTRASSFNAFSPSQWQLPR